MCITNIGNIDRSKRKQQGSKDDSKKEMKMQNIYTYITSIGDRSLLEEK